MRKRTFIRTTSLALGSTALGPFACNPVPEYSSDAGKNWAGNLQYKATRLFEPNGLEEVQEIVRKSNKIKALGTRHSFSTLADCEQDLISTRGLNKIIHLDKSAKTVTVESGIRYGELSQYLHQEGFALHNLASLPHISVAGACATATHGSGDQNGNLASIVQGLEIVKANGDVVSLTPQDPDFAGAVVHLGALGVVTRITLAIQPTFQVQQEIFEYLPLQEAATNFDAIFSRAYSVSFFTDWSQDNINQVWLKRRLDGRGVLEPIPDFYGSSPATRNMHPIASVSSENCTDQMAVPGSWHDRLPHFKLDFTPSNGDELQSEFFVDRARAPEVLLLLQSMRARITPLLCISEVRSIQADDLWMSTAQGGDKIAFHFTWKPDWEGVMAFLPALEDALEPFQARPHWAKLFVMEADKINALYPKINDFKDLVQRYDPEGKFRNEYLEKCLTV